MTRPDVSVELRRATENDYQDVAEMCRRCELDPWLAEVFAATARRIVVVAVVADQIVGVAKTHYYAEADGEAPAGHYLGGLVVDPRARRQGLGLLLIEARLAWIWERNDRAFYFTNERNHASIRLHRRMGFTPIATAGSLHGVRADGDGASLVLGQASRPHNADD